MRRVHSFSWPAPARGWMTSGNIATSPLDAAEQLDNFFPTAQAAELRRGYTLHATLDATAERFMTYTYGDTNKLFAATDTDIFEIYTPADPEVTPTATKSSLTSGDWSSVQFSTAGGVFMVAVNGADNAIYYDGTSLTEITAVSSPIAITGVDTADLSQLWLFKERLFFVEKDTQSVWYLPVESIGGAASEINLGSVFRRGGVVLFGANWSLDSGEGIDDKCVFVTDQGEVAIFSGTDPASASTWSLDGVYSIGRPVDKHAAFKVGGELMIVTDEGIVPISQAIAKDRSGLIASAMTAPIEDAWQTVIARRSSSQPICVAHWVSQGRLYVATPDRNRNRPVAYVANSRTGAWCRYTNWDVRSITEFQNSVYFGADGGAVYLGEAGGTDAGTAYSGVWVPKFSDFGSPDRKHANRVALHARSNVSVKYAARILTEFNVSDIMEPSPLDEPSDTATWGAATWGSFVWGGNSTLSGGISWKSTGAHGHFLAPGIVVTSNQTTAPQFEVTAIQIRYEVGVAL